MLNIIYEPKSFIKRIFCMHHFLRLCRHTDFLQEWYCAKCGKRKVTSINWNPGVQYLPEVKKYGSWIDS